MSARPLSRGQRIKSDRPQTVAITRQRDTEPLWFLFVADTLPAPYVNLLSEHPAVSRTKRLLDDCFCVVLYPGEMVPPNETLGIEFIDLFCA